MIEANLVNESNLEVLLNDVADLYGYDFTQYSKASIKRRINRLCLIDNFKSVAELRYRILKDAGYLSRFVEEVTVNVTEMFGDPVFYRLLREKIIPTLGPLPYIRIWLAGCSTGEEVYSMAILLKEALLLHKTVIYATDINPDVLEKAKRGIYGISQMKLYSENYNHSGGKKDFSTYYTANYDHVKFSEELIEKVIFSTHNLVSDRSFNEFQLILCRNVLIYFDKDLQEKVIKLFDASMANLGYLALGAKETLRFSSINHHYTQIEKEKIWRKNH